MSVTVRKRLATAWKRHPLFTSAFMVMGVITLFLAVRLVFSLAYWSAHRDLPVEAWMPLGYIARSHSISVEEMRQMVDLPANIRDRRPIGDIAASRGIAANELIEKVEAAIERYKESGAAEQDR